MNDYLTISETAKLLNKSTKTLRRWDEEGKLSAVREPMSNYRVYRKDDVQALFSEFIQDEIIETVSNFADPRPSTRRFSPWHAPDQVGKTSFSSRDNHWAKIGSRHCQRQNSQKVAYLHG